MNTDTLNSNRFFYLCSSVFICGFLFAHYPAIAKEPRLDSASYIEVRGGLANSRHVFAQGGEARVAFLGGSITQMTGWRDLVCEDLQTRFPNTAFDFAQAGVASMGSTPGAYRIARDVLDRGLVDLLFVEAAVNDSTNHRTPTEQIRGMEGIVRHARSNNPNVDIVHLHFVDPDKMEAYRTGKTPEVIANHERVAEHYGNPSIDLAREVTERIDAGEFTWDGDFKDLHPSPFGHQVYLRSIQRLFDLAWGGPAPGAIQSHKLPETPLDTNSYVDGSIVSINSAESLHGFSIIDSWRPGDGKGTRHGFVNVPMLVADESGASFQFSFAGTAVGLWVAAGPDAGVIEYRIDNGLPQRIDLFTDWSGGLHLPWAYILSGDLSPTSHTLDVRVATPPSDREHGGNAVRIAHFLVNG